MQGHLQNGYSATRYHDISCGHRVYGHEGKCRHLHGHNYRIHFTCTAHTLDGVGRVIDFSEIKERLCMWVEENWDHRFLVWLHDPAKHFLQEIDSKVVVVPFNPTAENMAEYLVTVVGPTVLPSGIALTTVKIEETAKCSITFGVTHG